MEGVKGMPRCPFGNMAESPTAIRPLDVGEPAAWPMSDFALKEVFGLTLGPLEVHR